MSFLKLHLGDNPMRIITPLYQYYAHPTYIPRQANFWEQKIKCIRYGVVRIGDPPPICPICVSGDTARTVRVICGLVDYTNQCKLLDVDSNIIQSVRGFLVKQNLRSLENTRVNFQLIDDGRGIYRDCKIYINHIDIKLYTGPIINARDIPVNVGDINAQIKQLIKYPTYLPQYKKIINCKKAWQ